jgi:hypothetical protein
MAMEPPADRWQFDVFDLLACQLPDQVKEDLPAGVVHFVNAAETVGIRLAGGREGEMEIPV